MKIRLLFMGLLVTLSALGASAQEAVKDQAKCFTTWDDTYLYIAVRVDSPDVVASSSKPNQPIGDDDSVSVYVETAGKRPEKIDTHCVSMSISPAGGSQFCVGTADGKLEPKAAWTFKYGMNVQGTINNSDDIDMNYNIEMAIPWELMNATPPGMGDMISFNVLVRRHGGGFVSISPQVKNEADVLCPAKWSKLVFAQYSFAVATTGVEKIISAKYVTRAPLINGVISDKEWHANTAFAVDLPMPEGVVYEAKFPAQKTIAASYALWQQLKDATGSYSSTNFRDFPLKAAGPWSGCDRTQYNKDELSDMVAAGVDVVLPYYTSKGPDALCLMHLVSAIDELKSEGKPYPRVGFMLSGAENGTPLQDAQRDAYRTIKDFFNRVPVEYRAIAQVGKPRNGQVGDVLFDCAAQIDRQEYCTTQFEKDFGRPLAFVSHNPGLVRIGDVSPTSVYEPKTKLGVDKMWSSMGGAAYESNWVETLKQNPNWVLCNSWNSLMGVGQLCATRQNGRKYIDATAANAKRFRGNLDFDAQYPRYSVPSVIPPQQFAMAEIEVKNAGNSAWRASEGYAIGYRWYRGGRFYGESKIRRPLERDVMPGESITLTVGIATVNEQGAPMPEGPYEARIELIRLADNKWFSSLADQPLVVPILVGKTPEWAASWISGHAPAMMAAGQDYRAEFRVRNDGSSVWPKGATKLGCKLYKINGANENAEPVATREISATLVKDCKPGEIAEFVLDVNLTGVDKKPVAVAGKADDWSYQLAFDIYNGQQWLSEVGVKPLRQTVAVFENDYGPRIVDCGIPSKLKAGQTVAGKVVVRNTGTQMWDKKRVKLGYHWYHLDGAEMLWDGPTTPIPANVAPGMPIVMNAKVTAPAYDGQYVLVWDMMIDDVWQSTQPLNRGGAELPVFVEVTDGRLTYADLSSVYDISGVSADTDMTMGDFDGKGFSFPAEIIPPDASVSGEACRVYPTGYQIDRANHPDGRISFYYPDKVPGAKNAIACDGQKASFDKGAYRVLHILGASSDGDAVGELTLNYSDGDQPAKLEMSDWGGVAAHGEKIGVQAPHRHSNVGDEISKVCNLYHYTIALDGRKTLAALTLPKNVKMKVVAVTLEK